MAHTVCQSRVVAIPCPDSFNPVPAALQLPRVPKPFASHSLMQGIFLWSNSVRVCSSSFFLGKNLSCRKWLGEMRQYIPLRMTLQVASSPVKSAWVLLQAGLATMKAKSLVNKSQCIGSRGGYSPAVLQLPIHTVSSNANKLLEGNALILKLPCTQSV